jgi:hypothetical protein
MFHIILFAGIGFIVGAFTPSVGRTIKAWFTKESTVVKTDISKKL